MCKELGDDMLEPLSISCALPALLLTALGMTCAYFTPLEACLELAWPPFDSSLMVNHGFITVHDILQQCLFRVEESLLAQVFLA